MRYLLLILYFACLVSCTYDKSEVVPVINRQPGDTCITDIKFSTHIQPILNTYCALSGCHEAGFPSGDFTNYAGIISKVDTVDPSQSILRIRINPNTTYGPMPPANTLTSCELAKVNAWIDAKAPNN